MGYYVNMGVHVVIPKENIEACLETLNGWIKGGKSWVSDKEQTDIYEAFRNCRYEAGEDRNGNVLVDCFLGEKWGDDHDFYYLIAPHVKEGSIEVFGEDEEAWRYIFEDGKIQEQFAERVWHDVETSPANA